MEGEEGWGGRLSGTAEEDMWWRGMSGNAARPAGGGDQQGEFVDQGKGVFRLTRKFRSCGQAGHASGASAEKGRLRPGGVTSPDPQTDIL